MCGQDLWAVRQAKPLGLKVNAAKESWERWHQSPVRGAEEWVRDALPYHRRGLAGTDGAAL